MIVAVRRCPVWHPLPRVQGLYNCRSTHASAYRRRLSIEAHSFSTTKISADESENDNLFRRLGIGIFGALVASTLGLGTWQANRYFWKTQLIKEREEALIKQPLPLPAAVTTSSLQVPDIHSRRVSIRGDPLGFPPFTLGPRSPPPRPVKSGSLGEVKTGAYLYQPFLREDGSTVIVNRGWVPQDKISEMKAKLAKRGVIDLVGILANGEQPNAFTPDNKLDEGQMFWLDHEALAKHMTGWTPADEAGLPLIIDELATDDPELSDSLPIKKSIGSYLNFYVMPMTHIVYAATWYSLAVCGAAITWFRFKRKPKPVIK